MLEPVTDSERAALAARAQEAVHALESTAPLTADERLRVEAGIRQCYAAAGVEWHGNVVWVPSPLAGELAAAAAARILGRGRRCDGTRPVSLRRGTGKSHRLGSGRRLRALATVAASFAIVDRFHGGALLLLLAASACTSPMNVRTQHPAATVFVDGAAVGTGSEVVVDEPVGFKRVYTIDARVGDQCRRSTTIEARQSTGRVLGGLASALAVSAAIGGSVILIDSDYTAAGLAGFGTGAVAGAVVCAFGGYEAPPHVDLDVSGCAHVAR
jgi:hypothetical protein